MELVCLARRAWVLPLALAACDDGGGSESGPSETGTIVAAVEEDGVLAVIDKTSETVRARIDLGAELHGQPVRYNVHNVQGAADGHTVWATAMPADGEHDPSHGGPAPVEELVGVDVAREAIFQRVPLGADLHVAHVVLDGGRAFVTANESDQVLFVDLEAASVTERVDLPAGTGPHGARLTPDGAKLVVAGMGDGSIHVVDTGSRAVRSYDVPGLAVQVAVLPDGSAAFATLYDTLQIARLDLGDGSLRLFDLPADSAGPVQIYPHPDGGSLWVADQGVVLGRPAGDRLYRIDAATGEVIARVTVGEGPHGVVVAPDGDSVWITLLVGGAVQRIAVDDLQVLATVPVGEGPNGITCLHGDGAMP